MAASDEELLERLPGLPIDHDSKDFYRGWLDRKLLINRCNACSRLHHPPRALCPDCWSDDIGRMEIAGTGTIHLLIWLHQGPPAPGVDYAKPYPVATVELTEQKGLRLSGTVEAGAGLDGDRDAIQIGRPVRLIWKERHGAPMPAFKLDQEASDDGA
jgi:uncharacterized OB-fold protein